MLWHLTEWAGTVLAAGVVAGLVVTAAMAAGAWLVYRWARRRVEALTSTAAGMRCSPPPSWLPCGAGGCPRRWCTTFAGALAAHPDWSEPVPRQVITCPGEKLP